MTWLTLLLLFKIGFTAVCAVGPLLLTPTDRLQVILGVDRAAAPYMRLYGWALVALLVGYAGGIPLAEAGSMPAGVVTMGITSNAGAAILMLTPWGRGPSPLMPTVFGMIAIGLVLALVFPDIALSSAFQAWGTT